MLVLVLLVGRGRLVDVRVNVDTVACRVLGRSRCMGACPDVESCLTSKFYPEPTKGFITESACVQDRGKNLAILENSFCTDANIICSASVSKRDESYANERAKAADQMNSDLLTMI